MSIWSKVLVGVILVATLPFFYMSLRLLKTNQGWRTEMQKWENAERTASQGPPPLDALKDEVRDAQGALHQIVVDRGRVWRKVNPERAFNSNTGKGTVAIEQPAPHRLAAKTVVFAFDPQGYLGEFMVSEAADKAVALEPNMKLSDRQLKRVSTSAGDWTLYEVMPIDRHDIFAGVDKETLAKMLPAERVDDYAKDGQPAQPGDPPARVFNGTFERQLTDYASLFHEMDRQISVASDLRAAAAKDAASLEAAVADAKQQVAFHTTEIADLKQELARSQAERDLIKSQYEALQAAYTQTREDMKKAFRENRANAQKWAEMQTRLAGQHEAAASVQ